MSFLNFTFAIQKQIRKTGHKNVEKTKHLVHNKSNFLTASNGEKNALEPGAMQIPVKQNLNN